MKVLILGSTGQDGYYLTELLLKKGYKVIACHRRSSRELPKHLLSFSAQPEFSLDYCDVTDFSSISSVLQRHRPDWIFNLAAQSYVGASFHQPFHTLEATGKGHINLLECIKSIEGYSPRVYFAGSSEMFGDSYQYETRYEKSAGIGIKQVRGDKYQSVDTPFNPRSPYAVAKVLAYDFSKLYRDAYNMDVRTGILFNHDSPYRGHEFVTRKITKWIGKYRAWRDDYIKNVEPGIHEVVYNDDHLQVIRKNGWVFGSRFEKLKLGNIEPYRDFGFSGDYVDAMVKIMEHDHAKDWVVSTNQSHSIKEFLEKAFEVAGLGSWENFVCISDDLKRPCEVPYLRGDSSSIRNELGWKHTVGFEELVEMMVVADIKNEQRL